jgi:hypothetical protein
MPAAPAETITTTSSQAEREKRRLSLAERARKITALAALVGVIAVGVTGAEGKSGPTRFNKKAVWAQFQERSMEKLGHGLIKTKVNPKEKVHPNASVGVESFQHADRLPPQLEKVAFQEIDAVNQLIDPEKRAISYGLS